jgi:hypothetical protein
MYVPLIALASHMSVSNMMFSQVFMSSVNSPLKPPTQNTNKDGTAKDGLALRKVSVSQGPGSPYGLSSPTRHQ